MTSRIPGGIEGRGAEAEGPQLLATLLEQLVEGQYDLWQQVAGRRELLRGGLRQAVREASSSEDVAALLERCWELLTDDRTVLRVAEFYRRDPDYEQVPVDHERVLRGALRLLATALAAVAARQVVTVPDATARLERWSRVAVELFAPSGGPGEHRLAAEPVKDPRQHVRQAYQRFGGRAGGALFWTLEWLEATSAADVMKVPVVGYHPGAGGFCADLRLRLIEGKGELVEHPDMALRPLGPELREVVLDAYRAAAPGGGNRSGSRVRPRRPRQPPRGPSHPVGEPPAESPGTRSVCWSLTVRDRNLDPLVPLDGGSLSGAARTGLLLLRAGQGYDAGSVIVAKVHTGGELRPVGFERDKLEAAATSGLRQAVVAPGTALSEADLDDLQARGLKLHKAPDVPSALKLVRAHRKRLPTVIVTATGLAAVGALVLLLIGYLTSPPPNRRAGLDMAYNLGNGRMRIHRWVSTGSRFSNPMTGPVLRSFDLTKVAGRMASGDVNGDGTDDVVMAYQNADGTFSYYVWLNGIDYAGTWYTSSGDFTLAAVGDRFTVGDYDGDGKADVAMAYDLNHGKMRIHRWTSTGSRFSNPVTSPVLTPFHLANVAGRMASGDVNSDGKDDIVMAYQNTDGKLSCHVWLNGIDYAGTWYTSSAKFDLSAVGDRFTW